MTSRNKSNSQVLPSVNHFDPGWTELTSLLPENSSIRDIKADPFNEDIVYIALGNKIYKSYNKGLSWENISGNLPNIPLNTIALYKNANDGIYVGMDAGSNKRLLGSNNPVDSAINVAQMAYQYHMDRRFAGW